MSLTLSVVKKNKSVVCIFPLIVVVSVIQICLFAAPIRDLRSD